LLSEPRRLGLFGKFLCPQPKLLPDELVAGPRHQLAALLG